MDPYIFKLKNVNKILDGDTIDAEVDVGFKIGFTIRIRLADIDCPETFRPINEFERQAGEICKSYLAELMKDKDIYIKSHGSDLYSRYLCDLYYKSGEQFISINKLIMDYMVNNHLTKEEVRQLNGIKS